MKQAFQLLDEHGHIPGGTALADAAEPVAEFVDQIWQGEGYTVYGFGDNSLLAITSGLGIAVDCDDATSVRDYIKWLGPDAHLDAERTDLILESLGADTQQNAA